MKNPTGRTPRFNRWLVLAAGLGVVAVAVVGVVALGRSHRGPAVLAAITLTSPAAPSQPGSTPGSTNSSLSSPKAGTPTTSNPAAASGTPSPTPAAGPAGGGGTSPPTNPPPPPPPPAYTFAPPVAGGTTSTSTAFVAADLLGDRTVLASFTVTSPGSVSLHGFESITTLFACLDAGQGCAPGQIPNPGYWTLTAADLVHASGYTVRVSLPVGSAGLDFGWNGPKSLSLSNAGMSGACNTGGYQLGCGVRSRVTTGGSVSIGASGAAKFHTKARDKATGTVVPATGDTGFNGATTLSLPHAAAWTIYLWSDGPAAAASMTISWP